MNEEDIRIKYQDLIFGDLGLCGCGCPEGVLEMIINFLKQEIAFNKRFKKENFELVYKDYRKWKENFINEHKEELFLVMLYLLNDREFMEHGSSVYSSWVAEKGLNLIKYSETISIDEVIG